MRANRLLATWLEVKLLNAKALQQLGPEQLKLLGLSGQKCASSASDAPRHMFQDGISHQIAKAEQLPSIGIEGRGQGEHSLLGVTVRLVCLGRLLDTKPRSHNPLRFYPLPNKEHAGING
jgi:hypothetical protein